MKILIIGSTGFIGTNLSNWFRKHNTTIITCDVVNDINSNCHFIIDKEHPVFSIVLKEADCDVCVNCTGAANVSSSFEMPLIDYNANVINVFKILESIRVNKPSCKFINISSAAVYGSPIEIPIKESANLQPISPYGNHKLQAELICKEFYTYFSISTCSLRLFSAYGNGQKKLLLWDLFQKFKNSSQVELFGTGKESRDYIHIDDICQQVSLVIQNATFNGEAYNIANGEEILIEDVVKYFQKFYELKHSVNFNNEVRAGDPLNWKADINTMKDWGYKQTVTIEKGIYHYLLWASELNQEF